MIDLNTPSFYRPVFVTNSDRAADDIEGVLFFLFHFSSVHQTMGMKATFQIWIFRVGNNRKLLCAGCFKCSFANTMGLNSLWSKYRIFWMRAWTTGHMVDRQIFWKVKILIVIMQWYFKKNFKPLLLVALFATFPSGVLVWTGFGRP